jgi:hypothetical protein
MMKDQTLIALLSARRMAERQAEPHQSETSKKSVIVPSHVWEKLMDATQQAIVEEVDN